MLIMISPNYCPDMTICIPFDKIYNITFDKATVSVVYYAGEKMEVDGIFQDKLEMLKVTYESSDVLKKVLQNFYNAVKSNEGLFYFGGKKMKKKSEVKVEILNGSEGDDNWLLDTISK